MKTETFYAKGRQECNAPIEIEKHGQRATASAEASAITERQLLSTLREHYPDYDWITGTHGDEYFGYRMGHGIRRE